MHRPTIGPLLFGLTMIGLGIQGFLTGDFTPTWSGIPDGFFAYRGIAYLCAAISLGGGLGILWPRTAAKGAALLAGSFLAWLVLVRLPAVALSPLTTDGWWGAGDSCAMLAAAWLLHLRSHGDAKRGTRYAHWLFGFALIPFGIAHFTFLDRTLPLIPDWLPAHLAIAYGTGAAFVLAGLAILSGVYPRLAAVLVTAQILGFTVIVWVPDVLRGPDAGQWAEFIQSVALTSVAWVVAESYRDRPLFSLPGAP